RGRGSGPLPALRSPAAGLELVRERERRLGGDAAGRPGASDGPLSARRRAAGLPRSPAEPLHAARQRRRAARLRNGNAPLPAEALPHVGRLVGEPAGVALRRRERRLPARAAAGRPRSRDPVGLRRLAGLLAERERAGGPRAAVRALPAHGPAGSEA